MRLIELRNQVRAQLPGSSNWSDEDLDHWIAEAIGFYSGWFPRALKHTLSLTTGQQAYDLPGGHDFLGIVRVEYPAGQTPPRFVSKTDRDTVLFRSKYPVYAIVAPADTAAVEADAVAGQIEFAETVTTGETAVIEYLASHSAPAAGDNDAVITVPVAHMGAIHAYVRFRALARLETDEAITVSNVSIVLAQLGETARRAWSEFKQVMNQLEYLESGRSSVASWDYDAETERRGW